MTYLNARRTLASTLQRALSSSSSVNATASRTGFAFALLTAKQTLPLPDSVKLPVRPKSLGSGYSPLNDPSPNWSNSPPKETILLDGCDYEHWLIVMEFPDNPKPSEDEMVNTYVKTLAKSSGGFGALISEELSYKVKGDLFVNGKVIPKPQYIDILKGNRVGVDLGHDMTGAGKQCKLKGETLFKDRTGANVREDLCSSQVR